jgi:hypothetical protein
MEKKDYRKTARCIDVLRTAKDIQERWGNGMDTKNFVKRVAKINGHHDHEAMHKLQTIAFKSYTELDALHPGEVIKITWTNLGHASVFVVHAYRPKPEKPKPSIWADYHDEG